jgi:hypothetical protein
MAEKTKPWRPSISKRGLRHWDHAKMNVRILGNAMAVQRLNDRKVVSRVYAKAQQEWDKLVTVVKQYSPFPKLASVKLTSEQLL